jgi:hypothetical protein
MSGFGKGLFSHVSLVEGGGDVNILRESSYSLKLEVINLPLVNGPANTRLALYPVDTRVV